MTTADAKRILDWVNHKVDPKKPKRVTPADAASWQAVMDAKEKAGDHGSVKAFCEEFLKREQGELL